MTFSRMWECPDLFLVCIVMKCYFLALIILLFTLLSPDSYCFPGIYEYQIPI